MGVLAVLSLLFALVPQADAWKSKDGVYAELTTDKGLIVMQLEFQKTPMTVANFVGLAEGTIKNAALPEGTPYFDGTKFHRVAAGHVIQTGIPANGKSQGPGYQFPNEIRLPELNHDSAGMVNMANSGPHTNAGQWCIMLGDRNYLDGDYTVFGHVVQGMTTVFAIAQGDVIKSVKIVRVGSAANGFHPTTESFLKMVEQARARVQQEDQKRKADEERMILKGWPQARLADNGIKYVVRKEGTGEIPTPGTRLNVVYTGMTLGGGTKFASTADGGKPDFGDKGVAFEFLVGKTPAQVNSGFDALVAKMKPGEKRTLIIPGAQAYGIDGFYAKEVPGQKRFHISPNTVLIYEVEVNK